MVFTPPTPVAYHKMSLGMLSPLCIETRSAFLPLGEAEVLLHLGTHCSLQPLPPFIFMLFPRSDDACFRSYPLTRPLGPSWPTRSCLEDDVTSYFQRRFRPRVLNFSKISNSRFCIFYPPHYFLLSKTGSSVPEFDSVTGPS